MSEDLRLTRLQGGQHDELYTNATRCHANPAAKCLAGTCVITAIAAAIIILLAGMDIFGAVGSMGFIASMAAGGGVLVIALIAMGLVICTNPSCSTKQNAEDVEARFYKPYISNQTTTNPHFIDNSTAADKEKQDTGKITTPMGNCEIAKGTKETIKKGDPTHHPYPFSAVCQQALDFAKAKLSERPDIEAVDLSRKRNGLKSPVNEDILRLWSLTLTYAGNLMNMLQAYDSDWGHQKVIEAADEYIKMSYALGALMLEDLSEFKKQKDKDTSRTYAEALEAQDSYLFFVFYECPVAYHRVRGEGGFVTKNERLYLQFPHRDEQKHAQRYYEEGTPQFNWRLLHGDFCMRARIYMPDLDRLGDKRPNKWTQADRDPSSFELITESPPT